jgi:hypothetical protein
MDRGTGFVSGGVKTFLLLTFILCNNVVCRHQYPECKFTCIFRVEQPLFCVNVWLGKFVSFKGIAIFSGSSVPACEIAWCHKVLNQGNVKTKDRAGLDGHRKSVAGLRKLNVPWESQLTSRRQKTQRNVAIVCSNAFYQWDIQCCNNVRRVKYTIQQCVCLMQSISNTCFLKTVAEDFVASFYENQFQVNSVTCDFYLCESLKVALREK